MQAIVVGHTKTVLYITRTTVVCQLLGIKLFHWVTIQITPALKQRQCCSFNDMLQTLYKISLYQMQVSIIFKI